MHLFISDLLNDVSKFSSGSTAANRGSTRVDDEAGKVIHVIGKQDTMEGERESKPFISFFISYVGIALKYGLNVSYSSLSTLTQI